MKKILKKQSGQALVTFIFFTIIISTTTAGALAVVVNASSTQTKSALSSEAYVLAESGVENALLRIVRDPLYTGETLSLEGSQVVITVSGGGIKTIVSTATTGNFVKQITATASYNSIGELVLSSWKETN